MHACTRGTGIWLNKIVSSSAAQTIGASSRRAMLCRRERGGASADLRPHALQQVGDVVQPSPDVVGPGQRAGIRSPSRTTKDRVDERTYADGQPPGRAHRAHTLRPTLDLCQRLLGDLAVRSTAFCRRDPETPASGARPPGTRRRQRLDVCLRDGHDELQELDLSLTRCPCRRRRPCPFLRLPLTSGGALWIRHVNSTTIRYLRAWQHSSEQVYGSQQHTL